MWHSGGRINEYGFEVQRPGVYGELEVIKVVVTFDEDKVVVYGPEETFTLFQGEGLSLPSRVDFKDQYLVAYFDMHTYNDSFVQLKVESEGLVIDYFSVDDEGEDNLIQTAAIWWEDL